MGLEIVFASAAEGAQGTLVAFQACVDNHVSLPVALSFDDQSTHRTLERFATILRRALERSTGHHYDVERTFEGCQKPLIAFIAHGTICIFFSEIHLLLKER